MQHYLDFEKELALLDGKANELRSINSSQNEEKQKNDDIKEIEKKSKQLLKKLYVKSQGILNGHTHLFI